MSPTAESIATQCRLTEPPQPVGDPDLIMETLKRLEGIADNMVTKEDLQPIMHQSLQPRGINESS